MHNIVAGNYLLASSDNGLHCWQCDGAINKADLEPKLKFNKTCSISVQTKNLNNTCVDSLILLEDEDTIISKSAGEGVIQIWKFSDLIEDIDAANSLEGMIILFSLLLYLT